MKEGFAYTIIFMAVMSLVASAILAGVNAAYNNKVEKMRKSQKLKRYSTPWTSSMGKETYSRFSKKT